MIDNDTKVDLTNCDREPIHLLGSIQPFGGLITANADWLVAHHSANVADMLGCATQVEPGARLADLFAPAAMRQIRDADALLIAEDEVERRFAVDLCGDGGLFDCALHRTGELTVIEFEPHSGTDIDRQLRLLQPILRKLDAIDGLENLCQEGAEQLKDLLGFDRVMVYRFHADQSGEVLAEARRSDLESFLGLRYPKTDIPAQARQLYLRNRFRIISDVNAEPVPIHPPATSAEDALDLSMSTLRAVSPIHIEYLRNMGVDASLSVSIIVRGKLWGLFACHNYSPKILPYSRRTGAELFSELFSLAVERTASRDSAALRQQGRELHNRLMRAIVGGQSLVDSLPTIRPVIKQAIPHHGASVFVDDVYRSEGAAPSEEEFRAMVPALNRKSGSRVLSSECLENDFPNAAKFADRVTGALIIPVSRSPRDYLILWRRELKRTVTWAGNPEKPVQSGPNGDRLTPRESFAAWQESVTGRSQEWASTELEIAESLRVTLLEIILRLTDDAMEQRMKAQQQQELLISELNHRVRNILNLIRGLINQSRGEAMDIETFSQLIGGRISALASAHDNITRQNWTAAPLRELIETEAEAYLSGKLDRLELSGPDPMIAPEAYTVLALVIHEMITNSAKYGALSDSRGKLMIDISGNESDGLFIRWKERGGPAVKAPTRRGFGSTIIEKSIPFELNGRAIVNYQLDGLEAEFVVPARYVSFEGGDGPQQGEPAQAADDARPAEGSGAIPSRALIVEDSMIIAMDAQDCLREIGIPVVDVESTVEAALARLRKNEYDFALLDYNLGSETSQPVAEVLAKRGVPFWIATGYGELGDKRDSLGAQGIIVKPYGGSELKKIVGQHTGDRN